MRWTTTNPAINRALLLSTIVALGGAALADPSGEAGTIVDPGVRWIQKCATQVLAFRTPSDAWLANACGGLYRSHDGGHHWIELDEAVPPLSLVPTSSLGRDLHDIEWIDERTGLIVGPRGFVVRSADGGQTWQRRALVGSDDAYDVEHVGSTVWVCDSRRDIFRSDDAGDTWRRLAQVPGSLGCYGPSFADRDHGWVTGPMLSHLWQTDDGGTTWTEVPTPLNLQNPQPLRLTRDIGWLYAYDGRSDIAYRTNDGGQHWVKTTLPAQSPTWILSRVRIGERERELTAAAPILSSADLEHVTPLPPRRNMTRLDEHTTVRLDGGRISWYRDGRSAGQAGLLSPPSGKTERLAGVVSLSSGKARWGWTDQHVYRFEGDGSAWFVVADTPEPFERIILLNDVAALARSRSGKLYSSFGWFKSWRETTEQMDQWEWSRRVPNSGHVASPVACLSTANRGSLSLSVVEQGCFHHRARELDVRWNGADAWQVLSTPEGRAPTSMHLTRADVTALLSKIVAIFERSDGAPACGSTSNVGVTVKWQCGSAPEQEARFSAPSCGGGDTGTITGQRAQRDFMRADALFELVRSEKRP